MRGIAEKLLKQAEEMGHMEGCTGAAWVAESSNGFTLFFSDRLYENSTYDNGDMMPASPLFPIEMYCHTCEARHIIKNI